MITKSILSDKLNRVSPKPKLLASQELSSRTTTTENSNVSSITRHFPQLADKANSVKKSANLVSCPAKQLPAQPTTDRGMELKLSYVYSKFSPKGSTSQTKPTVKTSIQKSAVSLPARPYPPQKAKTVTRPFVSTVKKSTPLFATEHLYSKPSATAKRVNNPKDASQDNLAHDEFDDDGSGDSTYWISEDDSDEDSDEDSDFSNQNFTPGSKDPLFIDFKGASTSGASTTEGKIVAKPKPLPQLILDQLSTVQIHDIVQCFLCPSKLMGSLGYVAHLAVKHQINTQTKLQVRFFTTSYNDQ